MSVGGSCRSAIRPALPFWRGLCVAKSRRSTSRVQQQRTVLESVFANLATNKHCMRPATDLPEARERWWLLLKVGSPMMLHGTNAAVFLPRPKCAPQAVMNYRPNVLCRGHIPQGRLVLFEPSQQHGAPICPHAWNQLIGEEARLKAIGSPRARDGTLV
jgi:hypothetical protein